MTDHTLVLNAGSGTVKSALYRRDRSDSTEPIWRATLTLHSDPPELRIDGPDGTTTASVDDGVAALPGYLLASLERTVPSTDAIAVVGHRVVHGGRFLSAPTVVDDAVREQLDTATQWAPLHNRPALMLIDAFTEALPEVTHCAVFDSGFHSTIPDQAAIYAGPYDWWERGLRRFGFHGISVADPAERAAAMVHRPVEELRVVVAHLGGGCSVTAVRDGHSVDTTMGLTPNEGLVMAERSGTVDPGLLTYVMAHEGLSPSELDDILNTGSGLLGLSGFSGDLGEVRRRATNGDVRCELAYRAYIHRVRAAIGAMAASCGGLDVLVFTGGAIENEPSARRDICENLAHLGIELDDGANAADGDAIVSSGETDVVLVRADEERVIARSVEHLTDNSP